MDERPDRPGVGAKSRTASWRRPLRVCDTARASVIGSNAFRPLHLAVTRWYKADRDLRAPVDRPSELLIGAPHRVRGMCCDRVGCDESAGLLFSFCALCEGCADSFYDEARRLCSIPPDALIGGGSWRQARARAYEEAVVAAYTSGRRRGRDRETDRVLDELIWLAIDELLDDVTEAA
jgi:hypothetical protein